MIFNRKDNTSPEFLTLLLENSNEGILAVDMDFNILYSNRRTLELHGYPADADPNQWPEYLTVLEPNGADITPFENLPLFRALRGEVVTDAFHVLKRKNKSSITVKYNARPFYDENNKQSGAVVTIEDSNELARSMARFKAVFDQSPLSIQILDKNGKSLLVNEAFQKLWDISDEFVRDYILKEYNILEDQILIRSGEIEKIRRAFSGETVHFKDIFYDPEASGNPGRKRWTAGTIYPLKDSNENVNEVVIIHQDTTDQHTYVEEREKLLSQLEGIVRQMPSGLMVLNPQGEVLLQNELMKNILTNYSSAREVFQAPLNKALKGERATSTDVLIPKANGLKSTFKTSVSPIQDIDGKITGSILMASDVTQEKRLETNQAFLAQVKTLLISTLDYDQILERVASSAIPYLADGCMVDILEGESIKRIVTKHRDPIIQRLMDELQRRYPPRIDSPQPTARAIRTGLSNMMKVDHDVVVKHCFDADHVDLINRIGIKSHIAIPLQIRGRVIGAINLFTSFDRTEFDDIDYTLALELARNASVAIDNATLYKDAKSAIQLRDDFISIASHELRTPITSLNLQIEVLNNLVSALQGDSEVHQLLKKFLGSTNNQLNRLSRLVDDMLDISRISSGKMNHNVRNVNFTNLTRDVLERFKDQLRSYQIESTFYCKEDIEVNCDPERMDQVITNFMTNAIRYGGKKPIHVIVEETKDRVILKVKDHGRGINKADQERIFNRFERAHTDDDVDGLGLGLYINNQIVKEHGGKILIESEPGKGATFIVELPKFDLSAGT